MTGGKPHNLLWVTGRLGHDTKHFNVGQYRRVQKGDEEMQDAQFFDPNNEVNTLLILIPEADIC